MGRDKGGLVPIQKASYDDRAPISHPPTRRSGAPTLSPAADFAGPLPVSGSGMAVTGAGVDIRLGPVTRTRAGTPDP